MDKNKKKSKPSSLHHYTSMSTLVALLNGIKDENGQLYFTFHASNAYQMNDKIEGTMLLDVFFTKSHVKSIYEKKYAKMEENEGDIYVMSLCRSDNKSKDSGSIPMWSMYGGNGKGAILVFNFDKLKEYVSLNKNLLLTECHYTDSIELAEHIKERNKSIKKEDDNTAFLSSLREEAFSLKNWHWEYEKEWRILVKSKESKLKVNDNGIVGYTEIKIPLSCLSAIIIGPIAGEFDIIKSILNKRLKQLYDISLNINHSKLQIR